MEKTTIIHKCHICGGEHYARDCEADANWRNEVDDGCWTFCYCKHCGKEFMEEDDHKAHETSCEHKTTESSDNKPKSK
jgi:hypothetical protein